MKIIKTGRVTYANWETSTVGISILNKERTGDEQSPRLFIRMSKEEMLFVLNKPELIITVEAEE